jgi:hypothetical protein
MGPIIVLNYHYTLCEISRDSRSNFCIYFRFGFATLSDRQEASTAASIYIVSVQAWFFYPEERGNRFP